MENHMTKMYIAAVSAVILLFFSASTLADQSPIAPSSISWQLTEPKTIGFIEMLVPLNELKTSADGHVKAQQLIKNEIFEKNQNRHSVACTIYYLEPIVGGVSYGVAAQINSCSEHSIPKAPQVIYKQHFQEFGEKKLVEKLKQLAQLGCEETMVNSRKPRCDLAIK